MKEFTAIYQQCGQTFLVAGNMDVQECRAHDLLTCLSLLDKNDMIYRMNESYCVHESTVDQIITESISVRDDDGNETPVTGAFFDFSSTRVLGACLREGQLHAWTIEEFLEQPTQEACRTRLLPSQIVKIGEGEKAEIFYRWHDRGRLIVTLPHHFLLGTVRCPTYVYRYPVLLNSGDVTDLCLPALSAIEFRTKVWSMTLPNMWQLLALRYWAARHAESGTDLKNHPISLLDIYGLFGNCDFVQSLAGGHPCPKSVLMKVNYERLDGPINMLARVYRTLAWPFGSLDPEAAAACICHSKLFHLSPIESLILLRLSLAENAWAQVLGRLSPSSIHPAVLNDKKTGLSRLAPAERELLCRHFTPSSQS